MTNQLKSQENLPTEFPQSTLQQTAENIYNIEKANNVNNIVNYVPPRTMLPTDGFYNLFVKYDEKYEGTCFTIPRKKEFLIGQQNRLVLSSLSFHLKMSRK